MHYVAFSRVTSIAGLYIESINEKKISVSMKVSDYLKNALQNKVQYMSAETIDTLYINITFKSKTISNIQYITVQRTHTCKLKNT